MNVNIKGAAKNTYDGIKQISDIIDISDSYSRVEDIVADINDVFVDCQPLLGAYCLMEHMGEDAEKRLAMLEKTFRHNFTSEDYHLDNGDKDTCHVCGLNIRDTLHIRI